MEADQTILRLLDEEIARLQAARSEIMGRINGANANGTERSAKSTPVKKISRKGKTREQQLTEFLKSNGPSYPKEILAGTGMPRGSFGFTLTRMADKIERSEDGKIGLKR